MRNGIAEKKKEFNAQDKYLYLLQKEKARKEREERNLIAHLKCKNIWEQSKDVDINHPYVVKKKIKPVYARQLNNDLVIPVFDQQGRIQSIQFIDHIGDKRFVKYSTVDHGYLPLGENLINPLRLCEGYATGCTIYEAVGESVFVCFNASNLLKIAIWLRDKYPDLEIHICADNDQEPESRTGKNTGLLYAAKAAELINAKVIFPDFSNYSTSLKLSDFNDLADLAGIGEVENQILK